MLMPMYLRRMMVALTACTLWITLSACDGSTMGLPFDPGGDNDRESGCTLGEENCACRLDKTCDGELICAAGLCLPRTGVDGDKETTADGDDTETADNDDDTESADGACTVGELRCKSATEVEACNEGGLWEAFLICTCGSCVNGSCITAPCSYGFVRCEDDLTALFVSPNPDCCPEKTVPCSTGSVCSADAQGCADPALDGDPDADEAETDTDTETDGDTNPFDCNDNNLCTADSYEEGICRHTAKTCGACEACAPATGECACVPGCAKETCDDRDNNCNNKIDESGVCDDPALGLRVELSWENGYADLNLHVLRPGGIFGRPEEIDPNDCFPSNPKPTWGAADHPAQNPVFSGASESGSGQNRSPEVVHIARPLNEPLRVLVHYANNTSDFSWFRTARVWVRILYNGNVIATYNATLQDTGTYWNVACIDPSVPQAAPIQDSDGSTQIITGGHLENVDHDACQGGGGDTCENVCDCMQGYACIEGLCQQQSSADPAEPGYCCDKAGCLSGQACYSAETGADGYCGFTLTFDTDTTGSEIEAYTRIGNTYRPWGAYMYTNRSGASPVADAYDLTISDSRGLSCGTLDNDGTDRWVGDLMIIFKVPGTDLPALASKATFFSGDTRVQNGLKVTAYDIRGMPIYEMYVSSTQLVEVVPPEPMFKLRIEPSADPNFVIDDLTVPMLTPYTAPTR